MWNCTAMEYTSRSRRIGHLKGKIIGLKTKHLIHSGTINFNQDDGVAVSSISILLLRQDGVIVRGPVVRKLISTNPELNFDPGFSISQFKSLFGMIFSILFGTSHQQIVDKNI